MTFKPVKALFPKRSIKMIDSSKKFNHQLAFELQNSHVCEKYSNAKITFLSQVPALYSVNKHTQIGPVNNQNVEQSMKFEY